jgi:xylulose-5-phosphate/fructose-6-phosphate phosphoketolase
MPKPDIPALQLSDDELVRIDAWWRAANDLAAGMIYLQDNPLLRELLKTEHIKNSLLGHWGTSPGLAFMYTHLNQLTVRHDRQAIFCGRPWAWRSGRAGTGLSGRDLFENLSGHQ